MSESQYVKRWKNWINRKKVFSPDELNELETYLLDKMESLQDKNNFSEKESFQQAIETMGESGLLNEEYTKIRKSPFDKVKWWALIQTVVSVLLLVTILRAYFLESKSLYITPGGSIFKHCGSCEIPNSFELLDYFKHNDKFCFLDFYSDNMVLLNLKKRTYNNESGYVFDFKGTLLPETILKYPISLSQDLDSTVYILEIGDKINPSYSSHIKIIANGTQLKFRT